MRRRFVRALLSGIVVVTTIGVLIGFRSSVQRVLGISTTSAASAQLTGFYLDIGASSSLGTQPDGVRAHNGHRTKSGYSDDLVSYEARHSMALTMREIGCPGETVQSMLGQLKDACYTLPNTQLTIATNYLATHADEVGVVTLDLGFNNIRACLTATVTLTSCVQRGIVAVRNDLPIIVSRLQRAAGAHVHFVGLGYGDPFLAYYLQGPTGRVLAQQGLNAMNQLNAVLQEVYNGRHVAMANVAADTGARARSWSRRPRTASSRKMLPSPVRGRGCAPLHPSVLMTTPITRATKSSPTQSSPNFPDLTELIDSALAWTRGVPRRWSRGWNCQDLG